MSTDLENITASFGLVRREFRDVHAIVSRLDTSIAVARGAIPSPRDLLARTLGLSCAWPAQVTAGGGGRGRNL